MDVVPYEPTLLPALTASYNAVTDGVPHCFRMADRTYGYRLSFP